MFLRIEYKAKSQLVGIIWAGTSAGDPKDIPFGRVAQIGLYDAIRRLAELKTNLNHLGQKGKFQEKRYIKKRSSSSHQAQLPWSGVWGPPLPHHKVWEEGATFTAPLGQHKHQVMPLCLNQFWSHATYVTGCNSKGKQTMVKQSLSFY